MIKSELVRRIAEQSPGLSAAVVNKAVDAFLDEISAALATGKRIEMRGFGSFFVRTWSARPGRNPKTGTEVNVPVTHHTAFRTGKEMRDRLNGAAGRKTR